MIRHKTAKGHEFNMAAFSQANATATAVGNVPRNAAGDVLNPDGSIAITAKDLQASYYNRSPNAVKTVSIKEDGTIPAVVSDDMPVAESSKKKAKADTTVAVDSIREFTDDAGKQMQEVTYTDGSMEVKPA